MVKKSVAFWMLIFGVSVGLLVSGGVALWNAGIVADENNLTSNFSPSLWSVFGAGLIGFVVGLPCLLGTITTSRWSRTS